MDYTRKVDSNEKNQDSELSKINQKTMIHSLNNKIFVNNSLLSEAVKINVLNGNDVEINTNFNNTLFYNHNDDNNKVNSTIRTQRFIFIPLVTIKILIPFLFYNMYLSHPNEIEIEMQENENNYNYCSYSLLLLIYICYFLSMLTSSKQMKIEKYLYKSANNNLNENSKNTHTPTNNENKVEDKVNNTKNENKNNPTIDSTKKDQDNNVINSFENAYKNSIETINVKNESFSEKITHFDLRNYNQICNYCHIRTFIRATHCLVCDECILFKEEHCPYIANCIGFNNLQYFINLLFWCIYSLTIYIFICIKEFINFDMKISVFPLIILISDFSMNIIVMKILIQALYKLLFNIYNNVTQYELQMEENNNNSEKKSQNLFNIGFLNHFYYLIGPTPFHFFFPLPKIKSFENDENCPIFLKCKFPNRLELIKYLAKRDLKYKDFLNGPESDPNNYINLCHNFYDNKRIE